MAHGQRDSVVGFEATTLTITPLLGTDILPKSNFPNGFTARLATDTPFRVSVTVVVFDPAVPYAWAAAPSNVRGPEMAGRPGAPPSSRATLADNDPAPPSKYAAVSVAGGDAKKAPVGPSSLGELENSDAECVLPANAAPQSASGTVAQSTAESEPPHPRSAALRAITADVE